MARKINMIVELELEHADEDRAVYPKLDLTLNYSAGCPAVMYQQNGDSGWPAEPPEIEIVSAKLIDGDGLLPTPEQVGRWADEWLESDAGYLYACEQADDRDDRY